MKKQILNLGKALNKAAQKEINGGGHQPGPNCRCFCHMGPTVQASNCQTLCPNGDIPGVYEGTPASCFANADYGPN
jgi:hypothetical protein